MTAPMTPEQIEAVDDFAGAARRVWWLYLVAGILSVLFGAIVLSFESVTLLTLAVFIGAFLVVWGIAQLAGAIAGREGRWGWLGAIAGLLAVGAGILTFAWPGRTLFVLAVIIGWSLVVWGVFDVVNSLMSTHTRHWWLYLIRGIVSVFLGLLALAWPGVTLVVVVTIFGLQMMIWGVIEIVASFMMRDAKQRWEENKRDLGLADS